MSWQEYIGSDPAVLSGKATILGTRVSVELVVELLSEGWSREQILDAYPHITALQLSAVFDYLKDHLSSEIIFPLPKAS